MGVYLDWPAGTLSFYIVSDTRAHLYTWNACRFTEPLYAGFGFRSGSSLLLCPREEVLNRALFAEQQVKDMQMEMMVAGDMQNQMDAAENRALSAETCRRR